MKPEKIYRFLAPVSAACLVFTCMVPVQASEAGAEVQDGIASDGLGSGQGNDTAADTMKGTLGNVTGEMETDLDSLFASMKESLQAGEPVSLSGALNTLSQTQIPTDSYMDLSSLGLDESADIGAVNLQYEQLAEAMASAYDSADLSSASADCITILNNAYGDLLGAYSLDEAVIPDGFSVSSYLSQASSVISDAYGDAINTSQLSSVKNSINTSDIFAAAAAGMSTGMPELESTSSLSSSLSYLSASNKVSMDNEYRQLKKEADQSAGNGWEDELEAAQDKIFDSTDKTPFFDGFTGREDSALGKVFGFVQDTTTGLFDDLLDKLFSLFTDD